MSTTAHEIPLGWERITLGDHVQTLRNLSLPRAFTSREGDLAYLHYGDIHGSSTTVWDPTSSARIRLGQRGTATLLQPGDIVFTDASEDLEGVGTAVEVASSVPLGGVAGLHTIAIRPDPQVIAPGFGQYLQFIPSFRTHLRSLAAGTKVLATNRRHVTSASIAIPPLEEQLRITRMLTDASSLTAVVERLILKKQAIKQGMMQQLLYRKSRLPSFSSGWVTTTAGEIGTFKGGSGFPVRFQGSKVGDLPFFKVSDMNDPGNEVFMRSARNYIGEAQRALMGAIRMPRDAIVFAKVGAAVFLERKRILAQPSCIDNNMAAMVVDPRRADARFMHYWLSGFPMSSLVATGALPSINGGQLRSIQVELPSELREQRAIAAVLADVDQELVSLEGKLKKVREIKQGMMQELLTGRTQIMPQGASA